MTTTLVTSMYNKSPKVIETIDKLFLPSLLRNASSDKELILLDDVSPAKAATNALIDKYMSELKNKFGNVEFIQNEKNLGFGPSFNRGIMRASGNNIIVVDDDVYFPQNSINKLSSVLSESDTYGIVSPINNEKKSFTYQYCRQAPYIKAYSDEEFKRIENFSKYAAEKTSAKRIKTDYVSGFCFAMPTELLQKMNGFDERFKFGMFEDTDLARRVNQNFDVIIAPDIYIHHGGVDGSSGSISQFPWKMLKAGAINQYRFGKKWNDHLGAMKHVIKGMVRMNTAKYTVSELFEQ